MPTKSLAILTAVYVQRAEEAVGTARKTRGSIVTSLWHSMSIRRHIALLEET